MDPRKALGAGLILAILGGLGMILAPMVGATELQRPWSFLAGFGVGVISGLGVTLVIYGLIGRGR